MSCWRRHPDSVARGIDGRAAGLAAFSLVLLCTGCPRIEHPYVLARGQSGAPGDSVVLLPVNTIAPLPFELQEDAAQVDEEIRRYLVDERGQRVSLLRGRQVRALWKQSVGEVEARDGPRGFAAAVGEILYLLVKGKPLFRLFAL